MRIMFSVKYSSIRSSTGQTKHSQVSGLRVSIHRETEYGEDMSAVAEACEARALQSNYWSIPALGSTYFRRKPCGRRPVSSHPEDPLAM